ncbi:acyl-CoA thioesterase [Rubeoparvulum massiliense]|uniref:acyl-CoA thioesterase n=1 Tax=Rubeoparvulum massiliense TaxID=1631346 RepID=UPI0009E2D17E|nr:acyl-CoA thioesterase [Rubeoparvulum massiliense]
MVQAKPTSASRTHLTDMILPGDSNYHGNVFGGHVLALVDKVGSICARKHSGCEVVTASIDSFDFLAPIKLGEAIHIDGFIASTGRTSMEIYIKVMGEDLYTSTRYLTGECYLTFVALDEEGKPTNVPAILPETEEEKWHFERAGERKAYRNERRKAKYHHPEKLEQQQ